MKDVIGISPLQRIDRRDGEDSVDLVKLDLFCPDTEELVRIWRPGLGSDERRRRRWNKQPRKKQWYVPDGGHGQNRLAAKKRK